MNAMMRMLAWLHGIILVAVVMIAGCGGPVPPPVTEGSAVAPKFGGTILPLPDKAGYVELGVKSDDPKAKAAKCRIFAYFVNSDGSAAPSSTPSNVSFNVTEGKSYPRASKTDAGAKGAMFESEAGPFAVGKPLAGELAAALGGNTVTLAVATR